MSCFLLTCLENTLPWEPQKHGLWGTVSTYSSSTLAEHSCSRRHSSGFSRTSTPQQMICRGHCSTHWSRVTVLCPCVPSHWWENFSPVPDSSWWIVTSPFYSSMGTSCCLSGLRSPRHVVGGGANAAFGCVTLKKDAVFKA